MSTGVVEKPTLLVAGRRVAIASAALVAGVVVALNHPLSPPAALVGFLGWTALAGVRRGLWLLVVPALLPVLDLSPWSGWIAFEEFDLVVLGAIAGGVAPSLQPRDRAARASGVGVVDGLTAAFGAISVLALVRGVSDAGGASFAWFDGYTQPLNSVRVAKATCYVLVLLPLLRDEIARDADVALRRLGRGVQVGIALASLAVLWERLAYRGLVDFSTPYRATALFWEMHVGGGTIDVYLALAAPFVAWSLWAARSRVEWATAAIVAVLAVHACLVTYSRGVYIAVTSSLAILVASAWSAVRARSERAADGRAVGALGGVAAVAALVPVSAFLVFDGVGIAFVLIASALIFIVGLRAPAVRWRRTVSIALVLALGAEVVAVVLGGAFLRSRIDSSERDFGSRLTHWRRGLELPKGPVEWLTGIGLGRLPARYAGSPEGSGFPGSSSFLARADGGPSARVGGPPSQPSLGGLYALTQRVVLGGSGAYRFEITARAAAPAVLAIDLCEQHLLYARNCQGRFVEIGPYPGRWQQQSAWLDGPTLSRGAWYAPRLGTLSLAAMGVGAEVEIANASLRAPDGRELLTNRDFGNGGAHWFPMAQHYFVPWHIDNLWLELLIERGVLGLTIFGALLACASRRLHSAWRRRAAMAPFLAASLCGALVVGTVSSVLDTARVSFFFLLILFTSLHVAPAPERRDHP